MNTTAKGNGAEKRTEKWLIERGYLVGSRRHIKGPGDHLATMAGAVLLIESKCTKTRYSNFPREERQKLLETAKEHGANPYLAWWGPKAKEPELIHANYWPNQGEPNV